MLANVYIDAQENRRQNIGSSLFLFSQFIFHYVCSFEGNFHKHISFIDEDENDIFMYH